MAEVLSPRHFGNPDLGLNSESVDPAANKQMHSLAGYDENPFITGGPERPEQFGIGR